MSDYESMYRALKPARAPTESLLQIARRRDNPFYVPDLENRAAEQGWQEETLPPLDGTRATLEIDLEPTTNVVCSVVRPSEMYDDYGFECIYDGGQPYPGQVERYVWLSPETTRKIEKDMTVELLSVIPMTYTHFC
ncbi:hypothetical protein EN45_028910 [Penicillium chrysogenum]|uniref:Uncharacterized protein n=2 Tax=Penicillium chrysogenum species complex TaxID=254878 RepID=A0A167XEG7_PENCH|nr:hypothetical protein EN45_028910 [Penicillium chrysogenum]